MSNEQISEAELDQMMAELEINNSAIVAGVSDVAPAPPQVRSPTPKVASDGTALNRFIDPDVLKEDIAINPADLDTMMIQHPSLYVHYATQTANARRQYERLKSAFEILEAKLDAEYREAFAADGKKVTEAAIRNTIVADKRWSATQAKVIDAQSIWKLCEVAERAFEQRKDMILEVARDRRKEKEGQMRVLEQSTLRESVLSELSKNRAA